MICIVLILSDENKITNFRNSMKRFFVNSTPNSIQLTTDIQYKPLNNKYFLIESRLVNNYLRNSEIYFNQENKYIHGPV